MWRSDVSRITTTGYIFDPCSTSGITTIWHQGATHRCDCYRWLRTFTILPKANARIPFLDESRGISLLHHLGWGCSDRCGDGPARASCPLSFVSAFSQKKGHRPSSAMCLRRIAAQLTTTSHVHLAPQHSSEHHTMTLLVLTSAKILLFANRQRSETRTHLIRYFPPVGLVGAQESGLRHGGKSQILPSARQPRRGAKYLLPPRLRRTRSLFKNALSPTTHFFGSRRRLKPNCDAEERKGDLDILFTCLCGGGFSAARPST